MKRFWKWLKAPNGWGLAVVNLVTIIYIAGSLMVVLLVPWEVFIYILLAVVFTVYSIYAVGYCVRQGLRNAEFLVRLKNDYTFRTILFACCSFIFTICYMVFNGVISVLAASVWYGVLTVYYCVLAFLRGAVLFSGLCRRRNSTKEDRERRRISAYRVCGIFLIVLTLVLSGALVQMICDQRLFAYANVSIYAAALYAALKIIFAIVNFFKAKKQENLSVQAIRNINFADALVSLLALQVAMLSILKGKTGSIDTMLMNTFVGVIVCVVIIGMGVSMIIKSSKLQVR